MNLKFEIIDVGAELKELGCHDHLKAMFRALHGLRSRQVLMCSLCLVTSIRESFEEIVEANKEFSDDPAMKELRTANEALKRAYVYLRD